jgi:hypothetical protein
VYYTAGSAGVITPYRREGTYLQSAENIRVQDL